MKPRVLLTNAIDAEATELLRAHAEVTLAPDTQPATLYRAIADADFVIARAFLPPDIFDHAPQLRAVIRNGAGVDLIPMAEANRLALPVANAPGANARSVAEYVVAQMLAFSHRLPHITNTFRARGVALPELFAQADYIVVACPLTDATRGLVGAALDVYEKQPIARDHPLLAFDNVLPTPHLAGLTHEALQRVSRVAVEETLRLMRGERPVNFVNPQVWNAARTRWQQLDTGH